MGSITETKNTDVDDGIKKELLRISMKGDWWGVVNMYDENPMAHKAKITSSGDTTLHMAISDDQEYIGDLLVSIIIGMKSEAKEVLGIKNDRGNTPLHLAASMGSLWICDDIASVDSSLVGARNEDNETPLFLAALHGKKEVFFCLHKVIGGTDKGYDYCRRKDGETILHCAIAGDYFDLAFQIIHLYPDLIYSVNERGFSPLHLLASKPSAFRSGSHLGPCYEVIYHCISVDKLEKVSSDKQSTISLKDKKYMKYPGNYRTCIDFFGLFGNIIKLGFFSLSFTTKREEKKERKQAADVDAENPQGIQDTNGAKGHRLLPANYNTCFEIVKLASKAVLLIILGLFWYMVLGSATIRKIREKKEKHTWSVQIMNEILKKTSYYEYENTGKNPGRQATSHTDGETQAFNVFDEEDFFGDQNRTPITMSLETNQEDEIKEKNGKGKTKEMVMTRFANSSPWKGQTKGMVMMRSAMSPLLIAAKYGIVEIVEKMLERFPNVINDMDSNKMNTVLLAAENRQRCVYEMLLKRVISRHSVFLKVDNKGNNVLHHAAMLGDSNPWPVPGDASQMQWEIKWFEFVKNSMSDQFLLSYTYNDEGQTPDDVFRETHKDLIEKGGKWLTDISQSCSVVAGLLVTVAYSTSTTVPGGVTQDKGTPILEHHPAFGFFAFWSLISFYSSLSAVVMFLSILISGYQLRDFRRTVFVKLVLGLTALYISIASTLASFTAGHYFILKDKLKKSAAPVYTGTCLLVTLFAIAQFPLYFKLVWAAFKRVPHRSIEE